MKEKKNKAENWKMHLCKITILGFLAFVSPVFKVTDENIFVGKWDHGIFFVNSIIKYSEN